MTFYVKGLEYLGTKLKTGAEKKRFVTLKEMNSKPSPADVKAIAAEYKPKGGARLKKVWVMSMEGNKWKKVGNVIDL